MYDFVILTRFSGIDFVIEVKVGIWDDVQMMVNAEMFKIDT